MKQTSRLLALLLALVLAAGLGACGDDDDGASESASGSASEAESGDGDDPDTDGDDGGGDDDAEPLTPEEARAAGDPAVYERIAATTDCAQLADELQAHRSNAEGYFADDPERGPVFAAYADATQARMDELACPANAGEAATSTTAPAS